MLALAYHTYTALKFTLYMYFYSRVLHYRSSLYKVKVPRESTVVQSKNDHKITLVRVYNFEWLHLFFDTSVREVLSSYALKIASFMLFQCRKSGIGLVCTQEVYKVHLFHCIFTYSEMSIGCV